MSILRFSLLGRFGSHWGGEPIPSCEHAKARELLCFLLLNRDKPNSRETIANYLWGGHYTTEVSKRYLRKALWQLNEWLSVCSDEIRNDLIIAETNWLELRTLDSLWLDVAFVDGAYAAVKGVPGSHLGQMTASILSNVVALYRGELLEGEYEEWTFHDLVRYRQIVLIMLDKLMDYGMSKDEHESVLEYGERALRLDPAREYTHLQLMRAYCALGDRTGAIRQFERCREVLRDELNVPPSSEMEKLFALIRADELSEMPDAQGASVDPVGHEKKVPATVGLDVLVTQPNLTAEKWQLFRALVGES